MISQAISDAYLDDPKNKRSVIEWLDTEDFISVCDHASINYQFMHSKFKQILSMKPALARFEGRKVKEVIDKY